MRFTNNLNLKIIISTLEDFLNLVREKERGFERKRDKKETNISRNTY